GQEAEAQLGAGQRFSQTLIRAMEKNVRDSRSFAVTQFDRHSSEFEVTQISPTGGFSLGSYRVSLPGRRCGLCKQFGHTRRSCPQRGSTAGDTLG
ncbi:hypothetical protein PIB30_110921, partial [Stylosanthes scabra]|nr:hypothetical protein [Stylosanthes scabra]